MKILIIDDEPGYLEFMEPALADKASLINSSTQAVQALNMFANALKFGEPYDVVLVDYRMPELNGVEIIKRIRAAEQKQGFHRTKIIMVTAYTIQYMEALRYGADDYINKPFGIENLREAVYGRPIKTT